MYWCIVSDSVDFILSIICVCVLCSNKHFFSSKMSDYFRGVVGLVRYGVGSAMLFGVTPQYLAMWLAWRGVSIFMPEWLYQWGDDKLYSLYQRLVLFFFETCTGVEVIMYGDTEQILKRKENVLYFANHQSTVDWLVADMVSVRGGNIGHLRYVMKNTLQLIPLYGWYFYMHGCIYVRRGNFDKNKMMRALDYLKHDKIPTWLVIFPEGTRYYPSTPSVIEKSECYARNNGLTVLQHHLVPKHRGTWLAVQDLHGKLDAVYDVSVFYEGSVRSDTGCRGDAPQLAEFLMGRCPAMHITVRRIPFKEVPLSEEGLKVWLHQLFVEKDRLLAPFITGIICNDSELATDTLGCDSRMVKTCGGNFTDDSKVALTDDDTSKSPLIEFTNTQEKTKNGLNKANTFFSNANSATTMITTSTNGCKKSRLNYHELTHRLNGSRSHLSLWETLPSFLLFSGISVSCAYFPWARKAYFNLLCYGTLGSYAWLAFRNVC